MLCSKPLFHFFLKFKKKVYMNATFKIDINLPYDRILFEIKGAYLSFAPSVKVPSLRHWPNQHCFSSVFFNRYKFWLIQFNLMSYFWSSLLKTVNNSSSVSSLFRIWILLNSYVFFVVISSLYLILSMLMFVIILENDNLF